MAYGPDHETAYLNDQLPANHPEYSKMEALYGGSVEGKRLKKFREQNSLMQDGLNGKTPNQLDLIILQEDVPFKGDPHDRIGKIMAIRDKRIVVEKDKIREMKPNERAAYMAAKETDLSQKRKSGDDISEHEKEVQMRQEKQKEKLSELERLTLERKAQRDKERAAGQKYLEEEAARRTGKINPAAAKQAAYDKAMKEEEETIAEDGVQTGLEPTDPLGEQPAVARENTEIPVEEPVKSKSVQRREAVQKAGKKKSKK